MRPGTITDQPWMEAAPSREPWAGAAPSRRGPAQLTLVEGGQRARPRHDFLKATSWLFAFLFGPALAALAVWLS